VYILKIVEVVENMDFDCFVVAENFVSADFAVAEAEN
jgi:hypothetical protein